MKIKDEYIYKYYIKERFLRKSFHRNLLMLHFFRLFRRSLHNIHPLWVSLSNSFQPSPRMTDHRKLTLSFSLSIFVSTFFQCYITRPIITFIQITIQKGIQKYSFLRYHVVVKKIARIILGKEENRQSLNGTVNLPTIPYCTYHFVNLCCSIFCVD